MEPCSPQTALRVHALLKNHTDEDGLIIGSQAELARRLGIGRSTAWRACHRLLALGSLEVVRKGTGDGYPTIYRVLDAPVFPTMRIPDLSNASDPAGPGALRELLDHRVKTMSRPS
jgi:hypothetical protein